MQLKIAYFAPILFFLFKCETFDQFLRTVLESNMWNRGIIPKLGIVVEFHMWDPGIILKSNIQHRFAFQSISLIF